MSFNPLPQSIEQRRYAQLDHAQTMLNIISALGAFTKHPLPKYDYGQKANTIAQQMNTQFLSSVLDANSDRVAPRKRAMQRRLTR